MSYNSDSGLYLTLYRAYDPVAGRWLSRDPIGEVSGRTLRATSPNLYTYARGNPISFVDPLGLWTLAAGLSGTFIAPWGGAATGSVGVVIDGYGNVGIYGTGGGGAGVGTRLSSGVDVNASDADTVCDLRGTFAYGSVGGGWGPSGAGNWFVGSNQAGTGTVLGAGVTAGEGLGAGTFVGTTNTWVKPLFRLW
jgi:RHS repeat-associated protein